MGKSHARCALHSLACYSCGAHAGGSAFSYRTKCRADAILGIEGDRRSWRRGSDVGRWVEQVFCPTCGTLVYMEGEGLPDAKNTATAQLRFKAANDDGLPLSVRCEAAATAT